jgi:hypothetical protein
MDMNEDWLTGNRYFNMAEFIDKRDMETDSGVGSSHEPSIVSLADL